LKLLLNQPEYLHVATNHLPLIGLLVAMLFLGVALVTKNRTAKLIGLAMVCLLSLSVWPVAHYGQEAYDRVLSMTDGPGAKFLDHHRALAERWTFLYFITAGVAAIGFALAWKWPKSLVLTSLLALTLAAASLAAGIAIAKAGGEIRHREFRYGPPPP
jgi:ABC-type Na+ efflux pump permease subunit